MKVRTLTILITIFVMALPVFAAEKVKVTGIFSSLSYNEEGGDLLGEEIFIVYGGQGNYFASVQCAQGGVRAPFIAKATITGSKITFEVPDSESHLCVPGTFKGVITKQGLKGEFTGNQYKVNLPRGNSYWQ